MVANTTNEFGDWSRGTLLYSGDTVTIHRTEPAGAVIKWLKRAVANHEEIRRRFEREIQVLSEVHHKNLVRVLHHGLLEDRPYAVLADRGIPCHYLGRLPVTDALHLVGESSRCLHYLHGKGYLLRNLRPSNMLVDELGNVCLIDLRCICKLDQQDDHLPKFYDYLAPEQARREQLTPAVDQFALGLMLLKFLTGAAAYPRDRTLETLKFAGVGISPAEIKARMAAVDDPHRVLTEILLKSLGRDPEQRFENCIAFTRAVTRAISTRATTYSPANLRQLVAEASQKVNLG